MVTFELTEEQKEVQQTVRAFAQETVKPLAEEAHEKSTAREAFRTMKPAYEEAVEKGLAFPHIPEEYGGQGIDHLTLSIAAEEICAADPGFGCILLVNGLGQLPVMMFGTDKQKERWLGETIEKIENGQTDYLWGYVISEAAGKPGGTANFDHPGEYPVGQQLVADYDEDAGEYVLNGTKYWPSSAGGWDLAGADHSMFVVRTDPEAGGKEGLSALIVPRETEGIEYNYIDKLGQRTNQNVEIVCDNAQVSEENLIAEGDGDVVINKAFSWSGPIAAAAAVGCARAAYEYVLDWAKTNTAGGADPIFHHQAVGYMLFDVQAKIEACRYLYWKAAHYMEEQGLKDNELHGGSILAGSTAKVFATETCLDAIYECMQVMGINAIDVDHPLNKIYQDASTLPLYDAGNVGVQRRKGWGVMGDDEYDPYLFMENEDIEFNKAMEGWGTEGTAPPEVTGPGSSDD